MEIDWLLLVFVALEIAYIMIDVHYRKREIRLIEKKGKRRKKSKEKNPSRRN